MVSRKAFTVFYKDKAFVSTLDKKNCHVYYVSDKAKYCIIYVDQDKENDLIKKIKTSNLVLSVEKSEIPYDKYKFEQK